MKGKPGKMLKLVRGDARNSRPGDHMSVIDGMPQGLEAAAAQEQPGAVQIPRQAGAAGGFQEGDRVMLARPFWGALDQESRPPTGREARGPSSTRIPRLNIS